MSRIAILHPQCSIKWWAIQMALQTVRALQAQGHTITLYTFEKSPDCFPDLQEWISIEIWHKKTGGKLINIITLAWHLRHFDMIIANNPPMQIVAALAKVFSRKKVKTVWWHHHVPWYLWPKSIIKSFIERYLIVPLIDQMVATSHFVAEKVREYCGRDSVVIHPVIQTAPPYSAREYPRSSTTPLKGGPGQEKELIQSQSPFQGGRKSEWTRGYVGGADEGSGGMQQHQKSGYWEYTYPANIKLKSFSHQMSREMTRAEQRLWFEVLQSGKTGHKWVKQKIIWNFIVDFYCHEKYLVIEVDGWVHQEQEDYDAERTKYLENLGIRVIRYTNEIVLNQIDQVREKILWEMEKAPVPLLRGGVANPLRVTEVEVQVEGEEIQDENGGMQPDTIPLPSTKISSPLKGALAADAIPVPLSRGEEIQHENGGMQSENTPVLPMVGHPLERGTGSSSADTVTLFTHGRLEAGKGLDMLTRVFDKIQSTEHKQQNGENIQLIIFWTGSLETKLREEGRDVRPFRGEETFSELSTGKYGHVIGVYCSSIDAFGMASLESQMAGFETIIMDSGGASEAILSDDDDHPVGYLVHSEEELFRTISWYVQQKTFPKQLSNVNFSHKRDYFSPTRLSSDLLSLMSKTRL